MEQHSSTDKLSICICRILSNPLNLLDKLIKGSKILVQVYLTALLECFNHFIKEAEQSDSAVLIKT